MANIMEQRFGLSGAEVRFGLKGAIRGQACRVAVEGFSSNAFRWSMNFRSSTSAFHPFETLGRCLLSTHSCHQQEPWWIDVTRGSWNTLMTARPSRVLRMWSVSERPSLSLTPDRMCETEGNLDFVRSKRFACHL